MLKNALSTSNRGLKQAAAAKSACYRPSVAINGFGRIGKCLLRKSIEKNVNVVALNQPFADINAVAYALKYDTVHGLFDKKIAIHDNNLCIDGKLVKVFHEEDPAKIGWKDLSVDYVIEASGKFTEKDKAMKHITAGAKKVIISAPTNDIPMFVKGVNFGNYQKSMQLVSNASGTTNCAAPLIKALHDSFCVQSCLLTTVHALTACQSLHDGLTYRSGTHNIIPGCTGAAKAVGMVIPELQGKVTGDSASVQVLDVSLLKLFINVNKDVTSCSVVEELRRRAESDLNDVLYCTEDDLPSSDLIGCEYSAVVDFNQLHVVDKSIAIGAWYDNEIGYSCRLLDLVKHMNDVDNK